MVELALLEEHGLTLPPARFPFRGFDRSGQTGWRRKALDDTRRKIRMRKLLAWATHWLQLGKVRVGLRKPLAWAWRVLTLDRWRK